MASFLCIGQICALDQQLEDLSAALTVLKEKLTGQVAPPIPIEPVVVPPAPPLPSNEQKVALTALKKELTTILKSIIDPYRTFVNEAERKAFFYFLIEQSLNAAKVMQVLAEKKYTAAELKEWYKSEKLPQMTQGALTQLDYKQYETREEWLPVPSIPGAKEEKSNINDARKLKANLIPVIQKIIDLNALLSAQDMQSFKAIFDEALKAAMAAWQASKKEDFGQKVSEKQ